MFPVSAKKCDKCEIFYGIFSLGFGNSNGIFWFSKLQRFCLALASRAMPFFLHPAQRLALFLRNFMQQYRKWQKKMHYVTWRPFLSHLFSFLYRRTLKYADKEKKTLGSLHVQWPFLFVWDRTKLWVNSIVVCDLQRHFCTDFRHFRIFSGIYAIDPKLEGTLVRPERMLPFQKLMPVLLKCIFTFLSPDRVRHYLLSIGRSAHFLFW